MVFFFILFLLSFVLDWEEIAMLLLLLLLLLPGCLQSS